MIRIGDFKVSILELKTVDVITIKMGELVIFHGFLTLKTGSTLENVGCTLWSTYKKILNIHRCPKVPMVGLMKIEGFVTYPFNNR